MAFASAIDHLEGDQIDINQMVIPFPERAALYNVPDDFLEPAGIITGDSVVIERGRTPRAGEFALVTIEGELMLRRISREGALVLVEGSATGIYPQHEVQVHGTATFVLRHLINK